MEFLAPVSTGIPIPLTVHVHIQVCTHTQAHTHSVCYIDKVSHVCVLCALPSILQPVPGAWGHQ